MSNSKNFGSRSIRSRLEGSYASTEGMAWAADETLDERVLDKVRRWLDQMEKAANRPASPARP